MKGHRLNFGSDSRPIIGSDFWANITSQYRPAIIQASIDHPSNIDSQYRDIKTQSTLRSRESAQGTLKARDPTLELNKARESRPIAEYQDSINFEI